MVIEIPVRSVAELIKQIRALFKESRRRWWFRGQSKASHDLAPSIRRDYTRVQERYFSTEFRERARLRHEVCPADSEYGSWLALMQHYGVPTRLLDWSSSPMVAAFFAIEPWLRHASGEPQEPRAVAIWALSPIDLNVTQGYENVIFPLSANCMEELTLPAFKGGDQRSSTVAVLAPERDMRMLMQQGAFTIHAGDEALNRIDGSDLFLRKYVITADSVYAIAEEVDLLGFRVGDIFPDLGSLARELKGYYRPSSV